MSVLQILLPCPRSVTVYYLILLYRHRQSSIWAFLLLHKGVSVFKHNNYKIFLWLSDLYKEPIDKASTKSKETRKASTYHDHQLELFFSSPGMRRFASLSSWSWKLTSFFFSTNLLGATHKPIAAWSPAFFRASGSLLVFTLSFIGSLLYLFLLWAGVVITLVLVLRHTVRMHSTCQSDHVTGWRCTEKLVRMLSILGVAIVFCLV